MFAYILNIGVSITCFKFVLKFLFVYIFLNHSIL